MPFLGSKYAKTVFVAGALPGTPLGSLQCSPRPPSWIKGGLLLRGGEGKERGREGGTGEEGKGRGGEVASPFLKFLDPPLHN